VEMWSKNGDVEEILINDNEYNLITKLGNGDHVFERTYLPDRREGLKEPGDGRVKTFATRDEVLEHVAVGQQELGEEIRTDCVLDAFYNRIGDAARIKELRGLCDDLFDELEKNISKDRRLAVRDAVDDTLQGIEKSLRKHRDKLGLLYKYDGRNLYVLRYSPTPAVCLWSVWGNSYHDAAAKLCGKVTVMDGRCCARCSLVESHTQEELDGGDS
jgi:hypothetical protein